MATPRDRALAKVLKHYDRPSEATQRLKRLEQAMRTGFAKGLPHMRAAALAYHEIKSTKLYLLAAESLGDYLGGLHLTPQFLTRVLALRVDVPEAEAKVARPKGDAGAAEAPPADGQAVSTEPTSEAPPSKPPDPTLHESLKPGIRMLEDLIRTLHTVNRKLDSFVEIPGTDFVAPDLVRSALQDCIRTLRAAVPMGPCGRCWGKQPDTDCSACRSPRTGTVVRWLPRIRYKQQSEAQKRKW